MAKVVSVNGKIPLVDGKAIKATEASPITDGVVVKTRDESGNPAEVDFYGDTLAAYQFGFNGYGTRCNPFSLVSKINFKTAVANTGGSIIARAINLIDFFVPEDVILNIGNNFALGCTNLKTVRILSSSAVGGYTAFADCSELQTFIAPRIKQVQATSTINYAMFVRCPKLKTVQLGSIGYGVEQLTNVVFNNDQSTLVITVYTTGNNVDTFVQNIRNGATNATIIIKASEDTTYNGTAYSAGDTIITSTVEATT